ncbi:MAG: DnaJ domain-containing protein [Calditrichaeota bacterium]|nr:DnaJ domain-containing protein [Calditrichota bacterium]
MDPKKDYYKILGLNENAGTEDIKKAYRRLAKEYHPDRRGGDKNAENRFKEISEAYAVLKDPKKRQEYDLMRKNPFASGYGQPGGSGFHDFTNQGSGFRANFGASGSGGQFGFDDLLGDFFGFGRKRSSGSGFREDGFSSRQRRKGEDYHAEITIPFEQAALGGETFVQTPFGKKVKLRIPAGTENGKKVKMTGQGAAAPPGGVPGDLYITIHVAPHPKFERRGKDIYSTEEINFAQAFLGTEIEVTTIYGKKVKLKIPAGTNSGKTFRLKRLGIESPAGAGDHYVRIMITTPQNLNSRYKKSFEEWARSAGLIS